MGLAERRKIKDFADGLGEAQEELNQFLGFELPVSLDLESFPEDPAVVSGYEFYKEYGFPQTIEALKEIGSDDLGKQALREQIQSVLVQNTSTGQDAGGECSLTLDDKKLIVKMGFYNYSDKLWDKAELVSQIESKL